MRAYFIRRLLLIPPTLFGVTLLVFVITRFVPGGPVEAMISQMRRGGEGPAAGGFGAQSQPISQEQLEQLKEYFGFDQPTLASYFQWLGVWPRDDYRKKVEFGPEETSRTVRAAVTRERLTVTLRDGEFTVSRADGGDAGRWRVRSLGYKTPPPGAPPDAPRVLRAELFQRRFSGVVTGDLGRSYRYHEPVLDIILERLPVSTYYGVMTLVFTYLISIPLGIFKAVKHQRLADTATSVLVFAGYAIPSYALGALLVTWLGARLGWFPTGGFTSYDFEEMSTGEKVLDVLHHSVLPLTCYLIGSFAFLTMLMKNQLMDNLASDYVRTAVAKGVPYRDAVRRHALRNAFIPIATHLGHALTLFVAGTFLIEMIFDINGFGLLGFESVMDRDYPVVMGIVLLSAGLMLLGNVVSDVLVALVDPRISFK